MIDRSILTVILFLYEQYCEIWNVWIHPSLGGVHMMRFVITWPFLPSFSPFRGHPVSHQAAAHFPAKTLFEFDRVFDLLLHLCDSTNPASDYSQTPSSDRMRSQSFLWIKAASSAWRRNIRLWLSPTALKHWGGEIWGFPKVTFSYSQHAAVWCDRKRCVHVPPRALLARFVLCKKPFVRH